MNAPIETLTRIYESEIVPLRKKIDAIDAELIHTLIVTQEFVHHEALGEALIYTLLSDDAFEEYRNILTNILRALKDTPKDGLSLLRHSNLEGDEMLHLLEKMNSLLSERFQVVKQVGELKGEFQEQPMDEKRWKYVLVDRKEKWTRAGGIDAETIIPAIWNPIHDVALKIEQEELKKAQFQHWMDENGLLPDSFYPTQSLEVAGKTQDGVYFYVCSQFFNLENPSHTPIVPSIHDDKLVSEIPERFLLF